MLAPYVSSPHPVSLTFAFQMAAPALEGTIAAVPTAAQSSLSSDPETALATLNEPVWTTVMRDVRMVAAKLKIVLSLHAPAETVKQELQNWDLWGPLVLCLVLSLLLSLSAPEDQKSLVFSSVFAIVWIGAAVVTANAQLLGGQISFFQSVCVLGYSLCPLVLGALGCLASRSGFLRAPLLAVALAWSCRSSLQFFGDLVPAPRRALAGFPVGLFYGLLTWMVFVG